MKEVFIINPSSAGGRAKQTFENLRPLIDTYFPEALVKFTAYPGHAQKLASEYARAGASRIIGGGGDGTFNEIVNGLFVDQKPIAPELVFGTLPMGTGGDLIKSLGISRSPAKALAELHEHRTVRSNVGHMSLFDFDDKPIERYFINLSNFGVGALTCLLVNQESKALGGKVSFLKGSLKALLKFESRHVTIKVNAKPYFSGLIKNIALANGKYCGGGMCMAPGARLDSGEFQLVLLEHMPTSHLLWRLPQIYWGGHIRHPATKTCFVRSLEAETDAKDVIVEVDGETPGKLPLKAQCLERILPVNVGAAFRA